MIAPDPLIWRVAEHLAEAEHARMMVDSGREPRWLGLENGIRERAIQRHYEALRGAMVRAHVKLREA